MQLLCIGWSYSDCWVLCLHCRRDVHPRHQEGTAAGGHLTDCPASCLLYCGPLYWRRAPVTRMRARLVTRHARKLNDQSTLYKSRWAGRDEGQRNVKPSYDYVIKWAVAYLLGYDDLCCSLFEWANQYCYRLRRVSFHLYISLIVLFSRALHYENTHRLTRPMCILYTVPSRN